MKSLFLTLIFLAASAPQEYVSYTLNGDPVLEKAWVVAPHVIITSPKEIDHYLLEQDAYLGNSKVYFYSTNRLTFAKSYLSEKELEVSEDIPDIVIFLAEGILGQIDRAGGIEDAINVVKAKYMKDVI